MSDRKFSAVRIGLLACLAATPIWATGCGTEEYERRLEAATERLGIENRFVDLEKDETLIAALTSVKGIGTRVAIRKPAIFAQPALTEDSANPQRPAEPIPNERLKPLPLANLPGFRFSFESIERKVKIGLQMYYLYLGVQASDPETADKILAEIKAAMLDAGELGWSTVDVVTPSGESVKWQSLEVRGKMPIWIPENPLPSEMGAVLQVLMRDEAGVQTIVAWRYAGVGEEAEKRRAVMGAVGTVRIESPVKIE